jgi:hypothetical protein
MTTFVYSSGKFVASIIKGDKNNCNFNPLEPWAVLHNTGRIDKFYSQRDARDECFKTYSDAKFKKS